MTETIPRIFNTSINLFFHNLKSNEITSPSRIETGQASHLRFFFFRKEQHMELPNIQTACCQTCGTSDWYMEGRCQTIILDTMRVCLPSCKLEQEAVCLLQPSENGISSLSKVGFAQIP